MATERTTTLLDGSVAHFPTGGGSYLMPDGTVADGGIATTATITLSGTVQAQAAGITGAVERAVTLSGTIQAQAAAITGAVERAVTLSGSIASDAAGITGAVERAITLSGTLPAQSSGIAGTVVVPAGVVTSSGTVQAQAAAIAGTVNVVELAVTLSGSLQAASSSITGVLKRVVTLQGILSTNASIAGTVIKSGFHVCNGVAASQAATMTGNIDVVPPTYVFPENRRLFTDTVARGTIIPDP